MSGIYLIKQKQGNNGYIGLDSRGTEIRSFRLEDHLNHAYHQPDSFDRPDEGSTIINAVLQSSEKKIAEQTPSNFNYYYVSGKQFYGLPKILYNQFAKIWKHSGNKSAGQSGAEICYIYHFHKTYASYNSVGGGDGSVYHFNIKDLLNDQKVHNLTISEQLLTKLNEQITWSPSRKQGTKPEQMNKLFYPGLQIKEKLVNILNEILNNYIIQRVPQGLAQTIRKDKAGSTQVNNAIRSRCKRLQDECNQLLSYLVDTDIGIPQNSKCKIKFNSDEGGKCVKELINKIFGQHEQLTSSRQTINSLNKYSVFTITLSDEFLQAIVPNDLPKWFPSDQDFTNIMNPCYYYNERAKLYTVDEIIPQTFEAAANMFNDSFSATIFSSAIGMSYDNVLKYYETNLSDIYLGISQKQSFRIFYHNIMNYYARDAGGDGQVEDYGGNDFGYKKARRTGGAKGAYIIVAPEYANSMFKTIYPSNITVG